MRFLFRRHDIGVSAREDLLIRELQTQNQLLGEIIQKIYGTNSLLQEVVIRPKPKPRAKTTKAAK